VEEPLARVRGRPGADRAGEQRGERERGHDLHGDEDERVVGRAGVRERSDVQGAIDPRREAPPRHLGDDHEERKRRKPSPTKERRHPLPSILRALRQVDLRALADG